MKASHAMVFYAIFIVVACVVSGGIILKRSVPVSASPFVSPEIARDLIDNRDDVVVIDVSRYFYRDGHLPGALNYPKCSISAGITSLSKDKTYLVYCHGFGSPMGSVYRLKEAGFRNVFALRGNYGAWADAGYPVED
jgi:rhodanese-related sulfurtransferase